MQNRDTVLIDLDGTLLPIDIDIFLKKYFSLLTEEFADIAPADDLISLLMGSTEDMIASGEEKLNKDVFIESFFSKVEINDIDQMMVRFDRFYNNKFPLLKEGI